MIHTTHGEPVRITGVINWMRASCWVDPDDLCNDPGPLEVTSVNDPDWCRSKQVWELWADGGICEIAERVREVIKDDEEKRSKRAMSEATHTPGPWQSDGNGVLTADGKYGIAILEPDQSFWGCTAKAIEDGETMMANAALIAAAPCLLAALKRLVDVWCPFVCDETSCECGEDGAGNGGTCEHIQAMRAIAKAEGRTT